MFGIPIYNEKAQSHSALDQPERGMKRHLGGHGLQREEN